MKNRNMKLARRGFSMVEIMVVVVVIGILAALIAPRMFSNIGKAKAAVVKQQIAAIESAVNNFYVAHERMPESLQELAIKPDDVDEQNWEAFLKAKDLKDPWGNDFAYTNPGENGAFDLVSFGKDGEEGGEGENKDIVNW